MSNVFKFQNEEDCCAICSLTSNFTQLILNAGSKSEVEELVSELVLIANEHGYKEALFDDVQAKIRTLRELDDSCDCDICDEDTCEFEN